MVRSFRRGAFAAVLALSLAPLAACAAGTSAETQNVQPDSASARAGDIKVQNAYVLTRTDGPAVVSARLFNNGSSAQTLQSVRVSGASEAVLSGVKGGQDITVPAHGTVLLGGKGNPSAVIDSGKESLRDGDLQTTVFLFSRTGRVSVQANVTPAVGFFRPYGPGTLPTTGTPSPSATPTDTPSYTATPTDTPSSPATGSPTNTTSPSDAPTP